MAEQKMQLSILLRDMDRCASENGGETVDRSFPASLSKIEQYLRGDHAFCGV